MLLGQNPVQAGGYKVRFLCRSVISLQIFTCISSQGRAKARSHSRARTQNFTNWRVEQGETRETSVSMSEIRPTDATLLVEKVRTGLHLEAQPLYSHTGPIGRPWELHHHGYKEALPGVSKVSPFNSVTIHFRK